MRKVAAALSVAVLAGCGSDSPPPVVFGGFTPQDGSAVLLGPATCDIFPLGTVSVSAVAIMFADYAGTCDVLTQTQLCGTRESSAAVLGVAVSGLIGGTVGPAGPGTYPVLRSPPTTDAFLAALGDAAEVGAACAQGTELDVTGGSIVLAAVSDTAVAGSFDLRFDDGSVFQHGFDVAVCPLTPDICALFQGCFSPVCAPVL